MAVGCSHEFGKKSKPRNMEGDRANCEYPVLTFKMSDGSLFKLDINGLPVQTFNGAELLRQSCNDPANWKVVERRGVSFADIFDAAGIDAPDNTPVNVISRDGWDVLRKKLGGDTAKIPNFEYFRDYAYVYVGSPGLKDPSLPVDEPGNFAKDPLYPAMEGKSLCVDYNHDTVVGAQEQAAALGMDCAFEGCFGSFRYKMLEKIDEGMYGLEKDMYGIIEINPQPE
jgi:hypothetical protein